MCRLEEVGVIQQLCPLHSYNGTSELAMVTLPVFGWNSRSRGRDSALNLSKGESGFRPYGPSLGRLSKACKRPILPQALGI
jgi:hypothetical protein